MLLATDYTKMLYSSVQCPKALPGETVNYQSSILTLGSCFSNAIGKRFTKQGFEVCVNPFGTLYNPFSMSKALYLLRSDCCQWLTDNNLVKVGQHYYSFLHHSKYTATNANTLLDELNQSLSCSRSSMVNATHLLLTFGSAYVYCYKATGSVVANCHKLPAQNFSLKLASVEALTYVMAEQLRALLQINTRLKVIVTVSPIRYLGYGAHQSQLSKARLLLLCDNLQHLFPGQVFYFPAYEIMLDELRDYRFYNDDLVHPSPLAEQIIFERFIESWAWDIPQEQYLNAEKLITMLNHKSRNAETLSEHSKNVAQWIEKHSRNLPPKSVLDRIVNATPLELVEPANK